MPDEFTVDPLDFYKVATDEYRFQVTLNWNRTQYYLALNVAIMGAGTGILKLGGGRPATFLISCVFGVGLIIAIFALIVTSKQHGYYQLARNRMKAIEADLHLPDGYKLKTTAGMRGESRKGLAWWTVNRLTGGVFAVLAAIDIAGIVYTAVH
jgi:hypothetical protein